MIVAAPRRAASALLSSITALQVSDQRPRHVVGTALHPRGQQPGQVGLRVAGVGCGQIHSASLADSFGLAWASVPSPSYRAPVTCSCFAAWWFRQKTVASRAKHQQQRQQHDIGAIAAHGIVQLMAAQVVLQFGENIVGHEKAP